MEKSLDFTKVTGLFINGTHVSIYGIDTANGLRGTHDDCVIASALAIQGIKSGINYLW